jgi:nucleoside-diphosphate-sugar epimerase
MKVLVTGANGFVGSHLIENLTAKGHFVYALVRNPKKIEFSHTHLIVLKGDLDSEELPWISQLPTDLDAVIHTAGIVHHYETDEFFRINALGTLYLAENLKKHFQQLHFILISSLAAGGPGIENLKRAEDDLDLPVSLYGKSKKLAEDYLRKSAPTTYTLSVIRPPMVIGPRDPAVLDIVKMVKNGVVILPGLDSLSKNYSFVCVFDLVETITKVFESKKAYFLYSCHHETVTFKELTQTIKKELKKYFLFYLPLPIFLVRIIATLLFYLHKIINHHLRLTPDKIYELEAKNWTCSNDKSVNNLGMVYQYNLVKTIKVTLEDYKKRHWI